MTALIVIVLGLIFGSFANVLIFRLPRDQSIVRPPSHCPSCENRVLWKDNIPLLSFLWLRGRCRHCKEKISIRYPVVELLTALLFFAVYQRFGWSPLLFVRDFPLVVLLIAITFIDLEHRLIPDVLSLGGLALGLLTSFAVPGFGLLPSLLGAAFGFIIFYALAWIYQRLYGRMGLGGGDVKLLSMLGAFLGTSGVVTVLLLSSVTGSLVGIGWALAKKEKHILKVAIPYGPFLVLGGLFYYLLGDLLWFPFMIPT